MKNPIEDLKALAAEKGVCCANCVKGDNFDDIVIYCQNFESPEEIFPHDKSKYLTDFCSDFEPKEQPQPDETQS